ILRRRHVRSTLFPYTTLFRSARDLASQKVEKATVQEGVLSNVFAGLEKEAVHTAFAEGWDLGSYQFLSYKSEAEQFNTELQVDEDRKSTRLNSSHVKISYAVF